MAFLCKRPGMEKTTKHSIFFAGVLDLARERIQTSSQFDLLEALRCFQPFNATLHVDKIYGLLGLLKTPHYVHIDYAMSPERLYEVVCLTIIEHTQCLDVFLDCCRTQHSQFPNLPSWVPDWSTTPPLGTSVRTTTAQERFSASRNTKASDSINSVRGKITVPGHFLGTIADVGICMPSSHELQPPRNRILYFRWVLEILTLPVTILESWKATVTRRDDGHDATLLSRYTTGETLMDALYHTLYATGGPSPIFEEENSFNLMIDIQEWLLELLQVTGKLRYPFQITPLALWPLAWLFCFPAFFLVTYWYGIVATWRFLRPALRFGIEMGKENNDPCRQTWTIGRTDCNLIGRFPAPGLTSADALPSRVGDAIVIFKGGSRPYVIRRAGDCWRLVGSAYIHGIMYGAAFREEQCVDIELV
ncbi:hypothetical protein M011DRAFT_478381 [Sporormia fimetaria CBS 119925]|uniref:Heterokaryon incompatibility domain-containing protein n=1 Tax=Sporormia fimetaria CBS 119925 TaxID=1340428 RepID=A0A6A6V5Y4_9PLEO|nr:hypothetical protein M011DRAFT_478381 [Sporormia fimetaria CBS 119925]